MENETEAPGRPLTVGQALDCCHRQLQESDLCYGHGTDNAWDEAVQLVLAAAELPPDADDGVLPHPLDEASFRRLQTLLAGRIRQRVPAPYLLGRAWFAGLEFLCDRRAIIPRSPIAELILNGFRPWYAGPEPKRILDLCCGGGCIGLAAAHYYPDAAVDLVDIDPDALQLLCERVEGNLLAAVQEVEKLKLLAPDGRIGCATVTDAVSDNARFNLFDMTDRALSGDASGSLRMLHGLRGEGSEPAVVLWALAREIRTLHQVQLDCEGGQAVQQALAAHRVWKSRTGLMETALARHDGASLSRLLAQAARVDGSIKGFADGRPWDHLEDLVVGLAQPAS